MRCLPGLLKPWGSRAASLPEVYNRGGQSALLGRRIRDARELGCTRLVVETAEGTRGKPSPSFQSMRSIGLEVAYVRPNYIYGSKNPVAA